MTIRVGINGFGRMGRLGFRAGWGRPEYRIVHVNEASGDEERTARLLEFDSVQGRWAHVVRVGDGALSVEGQRIGYSRCAAPSEVDWGAAGVDLLLECSGQLGTADGLQPYFDQGVRKVLVSAPLPDPALNIVYGINHDRYDPARHAIVTAASCTTDGLAPLVKVVQEGIGIRHGTMTTIHDNADARTIVDQDHQDPRCVCACGQSLIPTSAGVAEAITQVFPELSGRLNGLAVRVPSLNASLVDFVFEAEREVTVEEVNGLFEQAAAGPMQGILGYEEPLVSVDFKGDPRSAIVDAASTMVTQGTQVKLLAWYGNEWGYVNRMMELAADIARSL